MLSLIDKSVLKSKLPQFRRVHALNISYYLTSSNKLPIMFNSSDSVWLVQCKLNVQSSPVKQQYSIFAWTLLHCMINNMCRLRIPSEKSKKEIIQ